MLSWTLSDKVYRANVSPHWVSNNLFWYRIDTHRDMEYRVLDASSQTSSAATGRKPGRESNAYLWFDGPNVHPGMTLIFVDELIRHNKDFDLIVFSNRGMATQMNLIIFAAPGITLLSTLLIGVLRQSS